MKNTFFYHYDNVALFLLFLGLSFANNINGQTAQKALSEIKELKIKADFNFEDPQYIDLLNLLAKEYIYSNPDSTKILLNQSFQLSQSTNYKKGESVSLLLFGHYYSERGDKEKAYEYNFNALKIANKHDLKQAKVDVLNNIGIDYWQDGKNAKALSQYIEALEIANEVGNAYMKSVLNDNIALIYRDNGDLETALTFHEKSKQISLESNNQKLLARTLVNMAAIYAQKSKFDTANQMVNESIDYFKSEQILGWLSYCYQTKGVIALKLENYHQSIEWYLKSEDLCDQIDYTAGFAQAYIGLAQSYLELENLESAEYYALKALKLSTELGIVATQEESNLYLATINQKKGFYEAAYNYQKSHLKFFQQRSKENLEIGLGILRSEINFENQKNLLVEENKQALAKQQRYIYLAIGALLLAISIIFLIYKAHKFQRKHSLELKRKQEILLLRESELQNSNETKDKLFSVIAHDLKGPINSFYSLMKLYLDDGFTKEESNYIFPKALKEISGISELLNNLLLWAKTQMSGVEIKQ